MAVLNNEQMEAIRVFLTKEPTPTYSEYLAYREEIGVPLEKHLQFSPEDNPQFVK